MNRVIWLTGVLSILIGGLIYLGLRSDSLLMFRWVNLAGFDSYVELLRKVCLPYIHLLPDWIIYSAPNGLWMLSFTCIMIIVWGKNNPKQIILWSACLLFIALASELMQLTALVPGVFDLVDVVSYAVGCLIGLIFLTEGKRINE